MLDRHSSHPVAKAVMEFDVAAMIRSKCKKTAEITVPPETVCENEQNDAENSGE